MLKHKITSIIMGTLMLSGVMIGASSINNIKITNDNTKVVNKVLLSAPSSANERAVVVNTDNSPLVFYSSADSNSNSNITSYISVGEMLTILSSGNNFYKVKVQETGAVGYISAHNLQIITSGVNDPYKNINKQGYIINVSSRVNLRANATMSSNILAKLSNNTKINVLGKQGQWYKVNCNGTVGYIYQEYIGLSSNNIAVDSNNSEKNSSSTVNTQNNISSEKIVPILTTKAYIGKSVLIKEGAKIYKEPSIDSQVLKTIDNSDTKLPMANFAYSNEVNNAPKNNPISWLQLNITNDEIGYIPLSSANIDGYLLEDIRADKLYSKPSFNSKVIFNVTDKLYDTKNSYSGYVYQTNVMNWYKLIVPTNKGLVTGYVTNPDLNNINYNKKY